MHRQESCIKSCKIQSDLCPTKLEGRTRTGPITSAALYLGLPDPATADTAFSLTGGRSNRSTSPSTAATALRLCRRRPSSVDLSFQHRRLSAWKETVRREFNISIRKHLDDPETSLDRFSSLGSFDISDRARRGDRALGGQHGCVVSKPGGQHDVWSARRVANTPGGQHGVWSERRVASTVCGQDAGWPARCVVSTPGGQHARCQHARWPARRMASTPGMDVRRCWCLHVSQGGTNEIIQVLLRCCCL